MQQLKSVVPRLCTRFQPAACRSPLILRLGPARCYSTSEAPMKKTPLHTLHEQLGGKMVEFCGWSMPIQYAGESIIDSHMHTRSKAGLFDVSHMAQLRITGRDRVKFLESITPSDLAELPADHAKLSVYTNERGGIIDDTMLSNRGDHFYVVVNAGCADKDIAHYKKQLAAFNAAGGDAQMEVLNRSLLALQGPSAEKVLDALVPEDLARMPFMTNLDTSIAGVGKVTVTRCGYTGEDGFEIAVDNDSAEALAKKLLEHEDVKPAALGPRDTLRLEAGLCLYGHDLNEDITPIEASLAWLIGKRRRAEGGFLGAEHVLRQLKEGVAKKRVGFIAGPGSPPAREGALVLSQDNKEIGVITSGTHSPSLKKVIGMGYINTPESKIGTEVLLKVRGKTYPATVAKMPFQPTQYKRV